MKHLKKSALMALSALVTLCISANVYAVYDEEYKNAYIQNFDSASHEFEEATANVTMELSDGALDIKSDALCYYELNTPTAINDTANLNSSLNAKGLRLFNTKVVDKISDREDLVGSAWEGGAGTVNGYRFEYVGSGSNAMRIESAEDENGVEKWGFRSLTFINSDRYPDQTDGGNALRTTELRFTADTSAFSTADNNYIVVVEYLNKTPGIAIQIRYPGADGSEKTYAITGSELVTGQWTTARIELADADFTKLASGEKNSIKTSITQGGDVYFHSFAIFRNGVELGYTAQNKTVQAQIADTALYGHAKLSYDMVLPSGIEYNQRYQYNTGKNSLRVSAANSENTDVAAVVYDIDNDTADISCVSGGSKVLVYSGEIIDRMLTYVIEINDADENYTVQIFDGETPLSLENSGPFDLITGNNDIMYINVAHSPYSQALLSSFDNFEVSIRENLDTKLCAEDAYAIKFASVNVRADFELPLVGELNGSSISWVSSDPDAISVDENAGMAYVNPGETECQVTLTATVTLGEAVSVREYTFTVASVAGVYPQISRIIPTADKTGASATLAYSGTSGATQITFIAVSSTSDGSIRDKKFDTQSVPSNKYERMDFAISGLDVQTGDTVEYYIWDQDGRSLVNNSPSALSGLAVNEKAGNIKFSWNPSYDDNNRLVYMIYRDGMHIADCEETSYMDIDVEAGVEYNYEIVASDTNSNNSAAAKTSAASSSVASLVPVGKSQAEIDAKANGLFMRYADNTARIAYTEYAKVTDATGAVTECRYAPANKFMSFYTSTDLVDGSDEKVVILLSYLDTTGTLTLTYNGLIPSGEQDKDTYQQYKKTICTMEGTNTWKKIAIRIDDAYFRKASTFSGCDFGISSNSNNSLYVKKVEVVRASLYD